MPYAPEHKVETRKRIVASARRLFNRRGFTDVSIDEIMSEAGLTRGGFYHHFKTKDELYTEAVLEVLCKPPPMQWEDIPFDPSAPAPTFARQMIEAYLSPNHVADGDAQCPMVALPSDVARGGPEVRAAFERLLRAMLDVLAKGIGPRAREERALAVAALCVGGMVLARTIDDQHLAHAIREAARISALSIAELDGPAAAASGRRRARA